MPDDDLQRRADAARLLSRASAAVLQALRLELLLARQPEAAAERGIWLVA